MFECSNCSHVNKPGLFCPLSIISIRLSFKSKNRVDFRDFSSLSRGTPPTLQLEKRRHPLARNITVGLRWLNSQWPACRFDGSESVVIVAAQKRTLGGRELQLPCMSSLTSKTSTQKFFLRVLQVIIQLREDTRRANKKAKQTGRLSEWE